MRADTFAVSLIDPVVHKRFVRKAGALYGIIVALGFALFFWLPDALILRDAHYQGWWVKLVLGLVITIPISAVIGWLAASARWLGVNLLIWIVGGSVLAWIGGHVQFEGVSWLARLTDIYPSDRAMYPFTNSAAVYTGISMVVGAGCGLVVGIIGLVAVERAWDASTFRHGFSIKSMVMLGLCLPALLLLGLLADYQINATTRDAVTEVNRVIKTVRDPQADLVSANLSPMARYLDRMSPNYPLYWNAVNDELTQLSIDVQFDTGLVLRCPVMLGKASLCTDLRSDLDQWMRQLVTVKDWVCAGCGLIVDESVHQWLDAAIPTLGQLESVTLLEHHGGWLYLHAKFDTGRQIDCRFVGARPITVDLCAAAK